MQRFGKKLSPSKQVSGKFRAMYAAMYGDVPPSNHPSYWAIHYGAVKRLLSLLDDDCDLALMLIDWWFGTQASGSGMRITDIAGLFSVVEPFKRWAKSNRKLVERLGMEAVIQLHNEDEDPLQMESYPIVPGM